MQPLPLQLKQASGVPFYRQIVDGISDLIRGGQLEPGARMPSVRGLATQLAVSLITIRRAYADLAGAGLIVRRQGQGTFVSKDVGEAARRRAYNDAITALEAAVVRAQALGLSSVEISEIIDRTLSLSTTGGRHD